ncbi:hypothetical protein OK074_8494 [Actinobacteria bacterium OK074]|nr:hypothetical protein OK074_8494 [Actinobacteria bacterium OK074]
MSTLPHTRRPTARRAPVTSASPASGRFGATAAPTGDTTGSDENGWW